MIHCEQGVPMLDRDSLLMRQQRLETFLKVDIPILTDVQRSVGLDAAERLNLVLREYQLLLEACLQEVERRNKS